MKMVALHYNTTLNKINIQQIGSSFYYADVVVLYKEIFQFSVDGESVWNSEDQSFCATGVVCLHVVLTEGRHPLWSAKAVVFGLVSVVVYTYIPII